MNDFEAAIEWLNPICKHIVKNGRFTLPEYSASEILLRARLGIHPIEGVYDISEEVGKYLLYLSGTDAGAFDLSSIIASQNIVAVKSLPKALRLFAGQVLLGTRKRPKGARRDKTWMENQYKLALVFAASTHFNLTLTRNEASRATSASDAVECAFRNAGCNWITYENLRKLCTSKRYSKIREELSEWSLIIKSVPKEKLFEYYDVPEFFTKPE